MPEPELFDFNTKNLSDIEIDASLVNAYIGLTTGHVLKPHTKTKISRLFMSIDQFRAILPTSALPPYIRNKMVKLNAICVGAISIKPEAVKPKAPDVLPPLINSAEDKKPSQTTLIPNEVDIVEEFSIHNPVNPYLEEEQDSNTETPNVTDPINIPDILPETPFTNELSTGAGVEMTKMPNNENPFGYETNIKFNEMRGERPDNMLTAKATTPVKSPVVPPPVPKPAATVAQAPAQAAPKRNHHKKAV